MKAGLVGLATVGVASFVAAFILHRRPLPAEVEAEIEPTTALTPKTAAVLALVTGGGAGQATSSDERIMAEVKAAPTIGSFTSFFSSEVERVIISKLQAIRNTKGIGRGQNCKRVEQFSPDQYGGSLDWLGFQESFDAVEEVLTQIYPSGSPWSSTIFAGLETWQAAEREGVALWRWWLWWRTYPLAERIVCGFQPIT